MLAALIKAYLSKLMGQRYLRFLSDIATIKTGRFNELRKLPVSRRCTFRPIAVG